MFSALGSSDLSQPEKDLEVKNLIEYAIREEEVYYWSPSQNRYFRVNEILDSDYGELKLRIGQTERIINVSDVCPNLPPENWKQYNFRQIPTSFT